MDLDLEELELQNHILEPGEIFKIIWFDKSREV